jgi:phosphatidylglycerophosphatase A
MSGVASPAPPPPAASAAARAGLAIASLFGVGRAPLAPGTVATAVTLPLCWLAGRAGDAVYALVTVAVVALAFWAADEADRQLGVHDSGLIVIDEVAGTFVTLLLVPRDLAHLGVAFVVFRVLDIVKPPPIRQLDRHVPGGVGVVLDDVVAGLVGAVLLRLVPWP